MVFTSAQLSNLENAIASGARSVSYEGKTTTFGSLDEMLRVRNIIMRSLGMTNADNSYVVAWDRGYGDLLGGWDNQGDLYTGY
jgi:hypothetical protein